MAYRNYSTANGVLVDQKGNGDYSTISAAMAAAVSGQTIFVRDGTYTENFSGKNGVTVTAFTGDASEPNVIINGTVTFSTAGTFTVANCKLQTNNSLAVNLTGSAASTFNLYNCAITASNNTGIGASNTNSASLLYLLNCTGNLASNAFAFWSQSQANTLFIEGSYLGNSGLSNIQSGSSAGILLIKFSELNFPFITSGTCSFTAQHCEFATSGGALPITHNASGGGGSGIISSHITGVTSACISVTAPATLALSNVQLSTTAANAIIGTGTITYNPFSFTASSITNSVSTQTPQAFGPQIFCPLGISFDNTNFLANYVPSGPWTPTLTGASVAGTTTYSVQQGYYTRIGNLVTVQGIITISAATGTGDAVLGGLPFIIKNQTNGNTTGSLQLVGSAGWTFPAGTTYLVPNVLVNTTTTKIYGSGSGTAGGQLQMANAAATFVISLTYQV